MIKRLKINGKEKRDRRCKLTINEEKEAINLYKNGFSLSKVAKKFKVSIRCIHNILRAYRIRARSSGEGVRLLHNHVNVEPPEDFPYHLKNKFSKLIAIFLLTDGNVKSDYSIRFISTDEILRRYFLALLKEEFNVAPTEKELKRKNKETVVFSKKAYLELLKLSPSYKKCPRKESMEDYLNEAQPTLSFLKGESLDLLKECVRIAMSTEGSIHIEFPRDTIYLRLEFACAHPKLTLEWQEIFRKVGIESTISKSRVTWSGIKGLRISKLDSIKKFIEIGGFINGVKITGKSKYFGGIIKNQLLKKSFELKMNSFHFPNHFTVKEKIEYILNLVKRCE